MGILLFAKAISVSIVFLIMAHALTIDWATKSEQDFTNGYVVPFVASPARINTHTAFLCRVGRCPVIDCSRELVAGTRVRYEAVNGSSCTVKVWVCHKCNMSAKNSTQVSSGDENSRAGANCTYVIIVL